MTSEQTAQPNSGSAEKLPTVGKAEFSELNAALAQKLQQHRPLIVAHRGTGLGSIVENTELAAKAAIRQGADIIEIDLVMSTDGDFFVFHDGYERMHFGLDKNLGELSSAEIKALRYEWHAWEHGRGTRAVCTLEELLESCPDVLFNVDRSWRYWPELFEVLDQKAVAGNMLLKCPVEDQYFEALANHSVKYPVIPRLTEVAQLETVFAWYEKGVNVVGTELIAPSAASEFLNPEVLASIQTKDLLTFMNALSLGEMLIQFAGYDDNRSVLEDPAEGWGKLFDLNADIIQTDWPDLLFRYRTEREA